MFKVTIHNYDEFASYLGKEIGVSEYLKVTQDYINKFADATLDWQWIHTNPERAKEESPYKATIAHGYYSVSMLAYFWISLVDVKNVKMMINYGIENVRFGQPVIVDSEIRVRVKLHSISDLRGIAKVQLDIKMEMKDSPKPVMTGILTFLYHFEN